MRLLSFLAIPFFANFLYFVANFQQKALIAKTYKEQDTCSGIFWQYKAIYI